MPQRIFALLVVGIFLIPNFSEARITEVPINFESIQDAIDATQDGDTVIISPGIYNEDLIFDGREVVVGSYMLTLGGDIWISRTIIEGSGLRPVIRFSGGNHEHSTVRGLTVRNGEAVLGGGINCGPDTAPLLEDLVITGNHATDVGGAIYGESCSPTLRRLSLIDNVADASGGGVYFVHSALTIENCSILLNQSNNAAAALFYESDVNMHRVLVADNSSNQAKSIEVFGGTENNGVCNLDHLTLANNRCADEESAGLFINTDLVNDVEVFLSNCIIWNNHGTEINIVDSNSEQDGVGSLTVTYTDLSEAPDSALVCERGQLEWGEGIMLRPPQFFSEENLDYRLSSDSPCINTGDPHYQHDADSSRTDLGALGIWQPDKFIGGVVKDAVTEEAIPFAFGTVLGPEGTLFVIEGNEDGAWGERCYPSDAITIRIGAENFLPETSQFQVPDNDTLWIETLLDHSQFACSIDTITSTLDSGESIARGMTIRNTGNGPLTWSSSVLNSGNSGLPDWTLRSQISVGENLDENQINGVAFDGQNFYLSATGQANPTWIYVVNRNGQLIRRFPQPGNSRSGFRDLEWDGENLWGSYEDTIWAFDRDGNVIKHWAGPNQITSNIAFDPKDNVLWISGTTTAITAYDVEGNYLNRSFPRRGMNIFGLGWLLDAPDSSNLVILNYNSAGTYYITVMNTVSGDTLTRKPVFTGNESGVGLTICNSWDEFGGSVMLTIRNQTPEEGGDMLDILQAQPNKRWATLDPAHGVVEAGDEMEVDINILTNEEDFFWGMHGGIYRGDLVITHDGVGGVFSIPIQIEVIAPDKIETDINNIPEGITISALYPQPFNSSLTIEYSIHREADVNIVLTDISGRQAVMINAVDQLAGKHSMTIDGANLSSGLYLVRLESSIGTITRKVVLLK